MRGAFTVLAVGLLMSVSVSAQDATVPAAPAQEAPHNNVKKAIRWKTFEYTCNGETNLMVSLGDTLAKVQYQGHSYLMKQTVSADGNRYSDGKLVWWGKGSGGFLQEDAPDGNGKMILEGCKLTKSPGPETATVTGTVTYLQRIALPTNAVIEVKLENMSVADAAAHVVAQQRIDLGQRQVPVPFALTFDAAKIDPNQKYALTARITVDGAARFETEKPMPVLTQGNPTKVEVIVKAKVL
jgi:uncharacterized lipoprotein YbaY